MIDREAEYAKLREKFGFIPHIHECEIEMIWGKKGLKEHCPYTKRQLKKECYSQCDECIHMVYVVFSNMEHTKIHFIARLNEEYLLLKGSENK